MMLYRSRLMKEQADTAKLKDPNMVIFPKENDLLLWYCYLFGPEDSPFEAGIFKIKITIPTNYPLNPPVLHFQTRIFHPNIHFETGEVCMDVLKQEWNPQWTIESIMRAIGVILTQPNADSPLNCDAGNLIRAQDIVGYEQLAKYYTQKYAICKNSFKQFVQDKPDQETKKNQ